MSARANRNFNSDVHESTKPARLRFGIPNIVGFMSVDALRQYHSDLSQLKFVTSVPQGRLKLDLNHNIDKAVKRTTDDSNEKINLLLTYLIDHKDQLAMLIKYKFSFITYRRTLISVMCCAFNYSTPTRIVACLYKNCIYLCSIETPQDISRRQSRSEQEQIYCAWGYKFEQYMLSDLPNILPNIHNPVIENEEFSIYYKTEIGNHYIFYGAQIDGMLATNQRVPEPPQTKDFQTNLEYIRNNDNYLELKINREIYNKRQENNFRKFKLLRCWCQCYLAGLKGLLVGFRNDAGEVERVRWYTTEEIANRFKLEWNPQSALNYLDYFLTYVKETFKEYIRNGSTEEPLSLQFDVSYDHKISVIKNVDPNNVILPDWYLEAIKT